MNWLEPVTLNVLSAARQWVNLASDTHSLGGGREVEKNKAIKNLRSFFGSVLKIYADKGLIDSNKTKEEALACLTTRIGNLKSLIGSDRALGLNSNHGSEYLIFVLSTDITFDFDRLESFVRQVVRFLLNETGQVYYGEDREYFVFGRSVRGFAAVYLLEAAVRNQLPNSKYFNHSSPAEFSVEIFVKQLKEQANWTVSTGSLHYGDLDKILPEAALDEASQSHPHTNTQVIEVGSDFQGKLENVIKFNDEVNSYLNERHKWQIDINDLKQSIDLKFSKVNEHIFEYVAENILRINLIQSFSDDLTKLKNDIERLKTKLMHEAPPPANKVQPTASAIVTNEIATGGEKKYPSHTDMGRQNADPNISVILRIFTKLLEGSTLISGEEFVSKLKSTKGCPSGWEFTTWNGLFSMPDTSKEWKILLAEQSSRKAYMREAFVFVAPRCSFSAPLEKMFDGCSGRGFDERVANTIRPAHIQIEGDGTYTVIQPKGEVDAK
jgi:hypothetical protein